MKNLIKKRLLEDLENYIVNDATKDEFKISVKEDYNRYADLEDDLKSVAKKHMGNFSEYEGDTYGIIDAMHKAMDNIFQRV